MTGQEHLQRKSAPTKNSLFYNRAIELMILCFRKWGKVSPSCTPFIMVLKASIRIHVSTSQTVLVVVSTVPNQQLSSIFFCFTVCDFPSFGPRLKKHAKLLNQTGSKSGFFTEPVHHSLVLPRSDVLHMIPHHLYSTIFALLSLVLAHTSYKA